ncbi:MAG: hypothetical protein M5U09_03715 [Gammaproteobacteria bacterium]|nr:hypothetical protein [Gammaproteobacteria bacterium]
MEDHVLIRGTAPLRRIARRGTWEELALLEKLAGQPWDKELLNTLDFQFQDASATDADVSRETLGRLAAAVGRWHCSRCPRTGLHPVRMDLVPQRRKSSPSCPPNQAGRAATGETRLAALWPGEPARRAPRPRRAGGREHEVRSRSARLLPPQTAERFSLSMENGTVRQVSR